MNIATITIKTDPNIKEQARAVLEALGLDLQTAGNLFYRQVVLRKGVPFALTTDASPFFFPAHPAQMPDIAIGNDKSPRIGGWEGKFTVPDDFDEPLDDFKEYM
jgi:hypothetical protein